MSPHPSYCVGCHADWSLIPEHMIGGLRRYIEQGVLPGSFLTAVLCNDLRDAVARADGVNINRLPDYVLFLCSCAPGECWGSPDKVKSWVEQGGLRWADVYGG